MKLAVVVHCQRGQLVNGTLIVMLKQKLFSNASAAFDYHHSEQCIHLNIE